MSRCTTSILLTAVVMTGAWTSAELSAAILPKDSSEFSHRYEIDNADLSATGSTSLWTRATEGSIANISTSITDEKLNYTTTGNGSVYWTSIAYPTTANHASGATVEFALKLDAGAGPAAMPDSGFTIVFGDESHYIAINIGTANVYARNLPLAVAVDLDNTDDFNVFRVAQDADSSLFQIWRNGVQIGTDIAGIAHSNPVLHALYFGEAGSTITGTGSVDYIRFTAGAFAPIPEPATGLVVAGLAMMGLRRRRAI